MLPTLPPPFIRQMQALLGSEWALLETALLSKPPVSIRVNTRKLQANAERLLDIGHWTLGIEPSPIPWHPHGFYLSNRPVFTLDPRFHAGAYYVQEASSMFVYEALRQTTDFSKPLKILDLCAAPGGKSTLMADMISPDSLLVSNENIRPRTGPLRENLERWGTPNVAITSGEVEEYAGLKDWFDVVLADAPCSGEGLFRKDPDAMKEWSLPQVEFCAGRQRRILEAAVSTLKPGGVLLFSTCTYNAQENHENASWLAKTFDIQPVSLDIPKDWGIVQSEFGCQFYPHKVQGEGFYLAAFRKNGTESKKHGLSATFKSIKPLPKSLVPQASAWLSAELEASFFLSPSGEVLALPANLENQYLQLDKFLKTKWFGVNIGEFKGKDFIPSHALALSNWAKTELPAVELNRDQALLFLKKETFDLPFNTQIGWALARYEGMNLGWLKILPNRLNNYLPQERRIRMAIGQPRSI
ncbi:MAG: methyltransferase RsmF C-terminal domain-like protein [Saprospiraceae bacterium]